SRVCMSVCADTPTASCPKAGTEVHSSQAIPAAGASNWRGIDVIGGSVSGGKSVEAVSDRLRGQGLFNRAAFGSMLKRDCAEMWCGTDDSGTAEYAAHGKTNGKPEK